MGRGLSGPTGPERTEAPRGMGERYPSARPHGAEQAAWEAGNRWRRRWGAA